MKKVNEYIKRIKTSNDVINCIVKVDLDNKFNKDKPRVFCSFHKATKLMPDYYKIVLPQKIVENISFNDLNNKEILCDKTSLYITPKQLIEQLKKEVKEDKFEKERQEAFELLKRPHWDFTKLQTKWIMEVNEQIGEKNEKIKLSVALLKWDSRKNAITQGEALLESKIILFNQNYYLSYDEKTFKQIYTHELAHHYNCEKFGNISSENGHNGSWININYELNCKVFGQTGAKFILARDLHKYGCTKINYRYDNPDISEYLWMKDQESLGFVAKVNGWKLESNNDLIQKLNINNKEKPITKYLEEHKEKFNVYNAWMPMNKVTSGLSNIPFERFMEEIETKQNSDPTKSIVVNQQHSSREIRG